jgi:hypothetical protein
MPPSEKPVPIRGSGESPSEQIARLAREQDVVAREAAVSVNGQLRNIARLCAEAATWPIPAGERDLYRRIHRLLVDEMTKLEAIKARNKS